ncbi:MAG: flagellar export chaperone FliS [Candidatus Ozemobacteraceae bacterium]|jgi:flagellar protein FliS
MNQPGNPPSGGGYPPVPAGRRFAVSAYRPSGESANPSQSPGVGTNVAGYNKTQNDTYKKTQIETATPENLILMLYDGALRFMGQAEEAFEEKNIERISNLLVRVQAIFSELLSSLDKEKGGEIAANLERLYLFFMRQLSEANVKKDPKPMLQIKPLVLDLRNTWEQAMQQNQGNNKTAQQRPRLNLAV